MKLSKNLGRIATTFLATAMLAGLTAVPASAASSELQDPGFVTVSPDGKLEGIKFNLNLILPKDVAIPDDTFTFTMAGAAADSETVTKGSVTMPVLSGTSTMTDVTGTTQFDSDSTKADSTLNEQTVTLTEQVDLSFASANFTFTEPGVYKYTLTETSMSSDFETADMYYVYLFVERVGDSTDQFKVTGAELTSNGADGKYDDSKKADTITNYYQVDPDTNLPTSYDVVIGNTIAGAMGNKGKTFTFKVQITSSIDAGKTYRAVYVGTDTQDKDPVELTANQLEEGITLKDGQQLHIYGVSKGEGYSVTEVEANANGYVTTIDNNGTPIDQGSSGNAATGTVDNGAVTVTFTNTRNAIAPTGLVMNVAPYVLLVLVAAGAGYVFLRKREED